MAEPSAAGDRRPSAAVPWQFSTRTLVAAVAYLAAAMGGARALWTIGWKELVSWPGEAIAARLAPPAEIELHRELLVAVVVSAFAGFLVAGVCFARGLPSLSPPRSNVVERLFWSGALAYALAVVLVFLANRVAAALLGALIATALFASLEVAVSTRARARWPSAAAMWGFLVGQYVFCAAVAMVRE